MIVELRADGHTVDPNSTSWARFVPGDDIAVGDAAAEEPSGVHQRARWDINRRGVL
jgi:hypothetical protein